MLGKFHTHLDGRLSLVIVVTKMTVRDVRSNMNSNQYRVL
jgi:hypothetical protein